MFQLILAREGHLIMHTNFPTDQTYLEIIRLFYSDITTIYLFFHLQIA